MTSGCLPLAKVLVAKAFLAGVFPIRFYRVGAKLCASCFSCPNCTRLRGIRLPIGAIFWRLMARRLKVFIHKLKNNLTSGRVRALLGAPMKPVLIPSQYSVRATIASLLRHGDATLLRTAQHLGVSSRSLQRHLTRLGTSHSEIVAEVRLELACHLLAESDHRISHIAGRLGYAGASSFSRTFMRLMKIQPVVYRRQQLAQGADRGCRHGKRPVRRGRRDMAD